MLLRRHAPGDALQFLEVGDPENFVDVQVAVVTLCRVGVGTEKHHFGTVIAENNRVAGELDTSLSGKGDNVFSEYIGLGLTGR